MRVCGARSLRLCLLQDGVGVSAEGVAPAGVWRGSLDLGVAKLPLVFNFSGTVFSIGSQ